MCPTPCESHDCSLPGSSVHGILQARILEWVAIPSPGHLPDPGIEAVSPALAGGFFTAKQHASKVMPKILPARLQQYVNRELPDVQAGFRKGRGNKLPTSAGSWKKQNHSRKASISALLTMPKPLTVWITINCGKF